jgi:hypothetical protein
MSEVVHKLQGARYFTALNIRWGFNNIHIKEGDEWKAAFLINQGLFKLTVMFFGLTNSLATFQTMMNKIFRQLIAKGHTIIFMANIGIFHNNINKHHITV